MNAVLLHYAGYIRYFSKVDGQVNAEVEDYVKQRLIDCFGRETPFSKKFPFPILPECSKGHLL